MVFKKVANKLDVESGGVLLVEVNNREISLFNIDGDIYAIDEICSHADGPLSEGYLEGYEIECPFHGARFNIKTGEVTAPPAVVSVDVFDVRIVGDDIEIDV